ncbi:MAG: 50S ribosomal protein L11 methyltransferase [Ardenticatenaceae bacterium]|nr:50S ribosomal protein L11 methyltransferase [Ardenticatenaceae bacterium]
MRDVRDAQIELTEAETGGLAALRLVQPPGSFALTPASRVALQAVGQHRERLTGIGLDWGTGGGVLAIAAARLTAVAQVLGLDIAPENVAAARQNAELNGVSEKTSFFLADSYAPTAVSDQNYLAALHGQIQFILANPPSSEGDDGFAFRRVVLAEGRPFLAKGGVVFLNISYQYGPQRIAALTEQIDGYRYGGVLASTDWVPFDLEREDLRHCLVLYAAEEERGGAAYAFAPPDDPAQTLDARAALRHFQQTGQSPFSRWQTHLFEFQG